MPNLLSHNVEHLGFSEIVGDENIRNILPS